MKKRLMATLLALVMLLSLLPISALADESQATVFDDEEAAQKATGVKASKTISGPDSDGNYTITLSVEGTTTTSETTNNLPADVVLVVDTSGSMEDCTLEKHKHDNECYKVSWVKTKDKCWSTRLHDECDSWSWDGKSGFIHPYSGNRCLQDADGTYYLYDAHYDKNELICGKQEHSHKDGNCVSRLYLAQEAAKSFVGGLLANGSKINVGLADFSGKNHVSVGLTQNKTTLTNEIDSLDAAHSDGTSYEAGLNAAKAILDKGSNKQQFIVFISDGKPNRDNEGVVAEKLKNSGVTIMTVGIDLSNNEAGYLKAISSKDSKGNTLYYATSAAGLSNILATLRQTIIDSIPAGTDAVMTDIINTDDFELVDADSALTENNGTLTWDIGDIGKDEQKVTFKVKLKEGSQKVGELYTNDDVSLKFKSSKLENEEVTFTKNAIGTPFVEIYSVTYNDGVDEAVFEDQTTYGLTRGAKTPDFTGDTPTREDYTFKGWSPEVEATVGGDTYAIVYTAQWELVQKYTVKYDLAGGKINGSTTYTDLSSPYAEGDKVTITASDPEKTGYTFEYWKSDIENDESSKYKHDGGFFMPAYDVTLTAQWTLNNYTLSYVTNGGEIAETADYTKAGNVPYNTALDTPTDEEITKSGYTFAGWYSDEALTEAAPSTMPAENLTLYAKWIENDPTPVTLNLSDYIEKNLVVDGDGFQGETFTVKLWNMADREKTAITGTVTYTADESGKKAFTFAGEKDITGDGYIIHSDGTIEFTEPGEYQFSVKEVPGTTSEMRYGEASNPLQVYVEKKGSSLVAEPTNNVVVWNHYAGTHTIDLGQYIEKIYQSECGCKTETTFTFEAKIYDNTGTPESMPEGAAVAVFTAAQDSDYTANGKVTLKAGTKATADLKVALPAGRYMVELREVDGKAANVTYDKSVYTFELTVESDSEIGSAEPGTVKRYYIFDATKDGEDYNFEAAGSKFTFTNSYKDTHYSPSTPSSKPRLNTGDHLAYVVGYPDGTVRPSGSITRAEVSAILFRLLADDTRDEYFTTVSSFTDVKAGTWYNNSVATLEKAGVIVDTAAGGAFRPNEAITRAELAAMLAQFADAKPVSGVKFTDVSTDHWAYDAIAIAAKMGWIEGYPDGTFRPDATITRAEMMTLVNRALERVPSDEDHLLSERVMLTFPDCNPGDWFYIAVQEATNSHTYERAVTEKNGDEQWIALRDNRDWTAYEN